MQTRTKTVLCTLALSGLTVVTANSAVARSGFVTGPYVVLSAGGSVINTDSIGLATVQDTDHSNGTGKVAVGYWFNQTWGVETSYVPLGRFEQTYGSQTFRGRADSLAVSLLGRLPMTEKWSLIGKLNLAYNRSRDKGSTAGVPEFDKLRGSQTSLVLPGLAVNYQFSDSMSVMFEVEPRGSAADEVEIGYAGFGLRYSF